LLPIVVHRSPRDQPHVNARRHRRRSSDSSATAPPSCRWFFKGRCHRSTSGDGRDRLRRATLGVLVRTWTPTRVLLGGLIWCSWQPPERLVDQIAQVMGANYTRVTVLARGFSMMGTADLEDEERSGRRSASALRRLRIAPEQTLEFFTG
jgi:hypothetical protein